MAERPTRRETDLIFTLTPGETRREPRFGRTYQTMNVTTDGVVQVGLGQPALQGKFLYKGTGDAVGRGEPHFEYIEFYNTAGTPQTVTLQTSFGEIRDARLNLVGGTVPVSISATVNTAEVSATGIAPQAVNSLATASNLDIAANAARKLLAIYNDNGSNTVWLRDTGGTTAIGIPLGPKATWSMPFSGAIRVRNASGSTCDIYVTEIT